MRAREIVPDLLYMSSHPAKWREQDLAFLYHMHVVVLANREPPALGNSDVWHFPVVDSHKTVDPRIPDEVVPRVVEWIRAGEPVLVSCLMGRSRSGICCALVLREYYRLSGSEALDVLRQQRPGAIKREGPEEWLRALPKPSHGLPLEGSAIR